MEKIESMTIVNEIMYHGYITQVKHSFAQDIATENLPFVVLLTVKNFSKNIQGKFTLILALKTIEMTIAAVNYVTQYQLNFN